MATLNINVIHAQHLVDRERVYKDLEAVLNKYTFKKINKISINLISEFDPVDINQPLIQQTVDYAHFKDEDGDIKKGFNQFIRNMHVFQLSSSLKHLHAIRKISEADPNDKHIVIEDDVLYDGKLCITLERVIRNLPEDYDIVFLGIPNSTLQLKDNMPKFEKQVNLLPFNDSYIITVDAAKKIVDKFLPIKFVTNIQLSYLIKTLELNSYTVTPNVFIDGSKYGNFLTTLTPNNILLFNPDYMMVKNSLPDNTNKPEIERIVNETWLNQHPDFMHLKGVYYTYQKKYDEAIKVFEKALDLYQKTGKILNKDSVFLKDYMRVSKYIQKIEI